VRRHIKNEISCLQLCAKAVLLNRGAAALYRALASIILGYDRFSWN